MLEYLKAHPELVVTLALTILTAIFKPRTPEQYAAMPPKRAAFLKLAAAILPDLVKAAKVYRELRTGKPDPTKTPVPPPPDTLKSFPTERGPRS